MHITLTAYQADVLLNVLQKDFKDLANNYELLVDHNEAEDLIVGAFNAKKAVLDVIQQLTGEKNV